MNMLFSYAYLLRCGSTLGDKKGKRSGHMLHSLMDLTLSWAYKDEVIIELSHMLQGAILSQGVRYASYTKRT